MLQLRSIGTIALAVACFYLGWIASAHFDEKRTRETAPTTKPSTPTALPPGDQARAKSPVTQQQVPVAQTFRQLLTDREFEEAMLLYETAQQENEEVAQVLRLDVLSFLQSALQQKEDEALMALADAYLSRHYDDIDVLIIVAEYQRQRGYPDEAARVIQYAFTYAHQPLQQEKIARFFHELVRKTDALLAGAQRWLELSNFYQLLETIDLSTPQHQLRLARVYLELDDYRSAREAALPLTDNIEWAEQARNLLATVESGAQNSPSQEAAFESIPLVRSGRHYLITTRLNETSDVTLLLDTGASVTSLSVTSFEAVARNSNFLLVGSRLFNTANGVTRGTIYRIDWFSLGKYVLNDVEIAVLDFQQDTGVDGLLGMNVLQHFRFEIDQDKQVLHLQQR